MKYVRLARENWLFTVINNGRLEYKKQLEDPCIRNPNLDQQ